jgi:hypothetical protein
VPTDKGTRYRCRDFLPEGCPCKANWSDGSTHAPSKLQDINNPLLFAPCLCMYLVPVEMENKIKPGGWLAC